MRKKASHRKQPAREMGDVWCKASGQEANTGLASGAYQAQGGSGLEFFIWARVSISLEAPPDLPVGLWEAHGGCQPQAA